MLQICPPRPADAAAVEFLLDRAFGPGRMAKTSYAYRRDCPAIDYLSFTAWEDGALVGTIAYWPVRIDPAGAAPGAGTPALLLGPLATEPSRQGAGIGSALMHHSLSVASRTGHRVVVLVGDPGYYARFGFSAAAPRGIVMPNERPERLRVRGLVTGALDGIAGTVVPAIPTAQAESRVA